MPFLSLLSNPSNNVSIAGRAKYGVSAGAQYSFVPSPFGPLTNTNIPAVPTSISEDSLSNNASTFMFYVNGINSQGRILYWTIKHITTNASDLLVLLVILDLIIGVITMLLHLVQAMHISTVKT